MVIETLGSALRQIEELIEGITYEVQVLTFSNIIEGKATGELTIQSGERRDVGDVRVQPYRPRRGAPSRKSRSRFQT